MSEPNMAKLKPSRKKLRPGDVFTMHYPKVGYIFGRVIAADLPFGACPMAGDNLLYIYDVRSDEPRPPRELLKPDRLLIPPVFTNRLGWSRGYFQTVDYWPLEEDERPEQFCFEDSLLRRYRTFSGRELPRRTEPCGFWALDSYFSIDDDISEALGIPLAPEDEMEAIETPLVPAVFIHLPAPSGDAELALDEIEDPIIEALESAGVGEFDGHVISEHGAVLRVYGSDPDAIFGSIKDVLRQLKLPPGSYAMKHRGNGDGPGERVELRTP
ncbi:MAG: immunity 26/phosphotriesterase HocA family protein [Micromonosporaceae bacterium]